MQLDALIMHDYAVRKKSKAFRLMSPRFGIHQRHQQTLRALVHSIQLTDKIVWGLGCANGFLGRWDKLILHHVGQARPRHEAFVWKCSIAAAQDMGARFPAFFGKVEASGHFQCVTRAAQSQRFCEVFGV